MGSGFKDFAAGDILTAADVDGYLMRQTAMTFADASARDTALSGVLDEGMLAYLEDVNRFTFYTGTAWLDIARATASGLVHIKTQTIAASPTVTTVAVTNVFSSDFDNYRVIVEGIDGPAGTNILAIQFGSTTTGYYGSLYRDRSDGGDTTTSRSNNGANLGIGLIGATTDTFTSMDIGGPNAARRTTINGTFGASAYGGWFGGILADTTAYTGFTLVAVTGDMRSGTIRVYGYNNG